jgi:hypothetical protein
VGGKHTPIPWEVQAIHDESVEIIDPQTGHRIALADGQGPKNEFNSAFIVQAVNAYASLLSRLEACVISLECFKRNLYDTNGNLHGYQAILMRMLANDIALAKEVLMKVHEGGVYANTRGSRTPKRKVRTRDANASSLIKGEIAYHV